MIHTVTISDNTFRPEGNTVDHRELSCSCGWEDSETSIRSEAKAKQHILYTHGFGQISYAGLIEGVS